MGKIGYPAHTIDQAEANGNQGEYDAVNSAVYQYVHRFD